MNIEKKIEGTTLYLALVGRLDTSSAPETEKEIMESLEGVEELVIDCAGLEYISSSGLRILLNLQKKMIAENKQMKLQNVSELVMEVFDITGFSGILTIE